MWVIAVLVLIELLVRALLRGGPALWLGVLVSLVALGGAPDRPSLAVFAGGLAAVAFKLIVRRVKARSSPRRGRVD